MRNPILIAYMLAWILSLALGYLFASVGPVFYDQFYSSSVYAELDEALRGTDTSLIADYLRSSGSGIGKGISAMPSMHVAACVWMVLATRRLWPVFTPFSVAYLCIIAFGAVLLGWHYTSDVVVGATVGWLAFKGADRLQTIMPEMKAIELRPLMPKPLSASMAAISRPDS
jgi:membrane-associated phospholipid phosphatase